MTNCEEVKEYIKQLTNIKQEKDEIKIEKIEPFTIKIINFVTQNQVQNIEPFSKIKKIYDDKDSSISAEFEKVIYLLELLLDSLKEKYCKPPKRYRFGIEKESYWKM